MTAKTMTEFRVGDEVHKLKGYKFDSVVVAVFKKLDGEVRLVCESTVIPGMLHIFSSEQMEHDHQVKAYSQLACIVDGKSAAMKGSYFCRMHAPKARATAVPAPKSCPGCRTPYTFHNFIDQNLDGCQEGYLVSGEAPVQPYCGVLGEHV